VETANVKWTNKEEIVFHPAAGIWTRLDMNTLSFSWELPEDWSAPEGLLVLKAALSPTVNLNTNG
jgi:hypothetical protein